MICLLVATRNGEGGSMSPQFQLCSPPPASIWWQAYVVFDLALDLVSLLFFIHICQTCHAIPCLCNQVMSRFDGWPLRLFQWRTWLIQSSAIITSLARPSQLPVIELFWRGPDTLKCQTTVALPPVAKDLPPSHSPDPASVSSYTPCGSKSGPFSCVVEFASELTLESHWGF